jgi:hypothetical protein
MPSLGCPHPGCPCPRALATLALTCHLTLAFIAALAAFASLAALTALAALSALAALTVALVPLPLRPCLLLPASALAVAVAVDEDCRCC